MKKIAIVTACFAALSAFGIGGASAKMTGPVQMSNGMNANAKMMDHHRHHMIMKRHMMKKKMMREGM